MRDKSPQGRGQDGTRRSGPRMTNLQIQPLKRRVLRRVLGASGQSDKTNNPDANSCSCSCPEDV